MFSLREYLKKGFLDAVGKMSNYQIILNSAGWMEKGVFTEEDLTEISAAIEAWEAAQNPVMEPVEPTEEEIPVEDVATGDEALGDTGEAAGDEPVEDGTQEPVAEDDTEMSEETTTE